MARHDGNWEEQERELWERALNEVGGRKAEAIANDPWASILYHEAMWSWTTGTGGDMRAQAYEGFIQYMDAEYGIEWEDVFDWDAWREAYDGATV